MYEHKINKVFETLLKNNLLAYPVDRCLRIRSLHRLEPSNPLKRKGQKEMTIC